MKTSPGPRDGEVHLYALTLPHHPAELSRLVNLLAPDETARAGLLKSERVKKRYIAGRGLLREILGGYLGIEARSVKLTTGEHGKPCLLDNRETFCFNLAHSRDTFLLAITAHREVGVDIETIVPGKPLQEMAKVVFSPREQEQLSRLCSPHLEVAFYRYWVRKEACLKACGRGFSLPANSFDVSENTAALTVLCNQQYWQILNIDLSHRYCAALAIESCGPTQPPPAVVRIDHRLSMAFTAVDCGEY